MENRILYRAKRLDNGEWMEGVILPTTVRLRGYRQQI